ncbi:MAG: hypothetical protein D6798_07920 [Deltaproteobacteria bacterium]|nr:MAG: hypothetical protein D6798_07920 [Deltaproteobacteria bacterium]
MAEPLTFEQVASLFESLGIASFGAALPEGRIHWTNRAGEIVAHARCQAILSYAAANQSLMWAAGIESFQQAGVPCLPPPDESRPYEEDIGEDDAMELATQAAQLVNAQFLYAAPTGGGSKLFLAVRDFTPGSPDADPLEEERRIEATRAWAFGKLSRLAERLQQAVGDDQAVAEVATLLRSLSGQADQQARFVVPGSDLAPRLAGLATQARMWADRLPADLEQVAYALRVAANGFAAAPPPEDGA